MNKLIVLLMAFISFTTAAHQGRIDSIRVEEQVVIFSLNSAKPHRVPHCSASNQRNLWSVSRKSYTGQTIYNLLLVASAQGKNIEVVSANDCSDINGIERVHSVSIVAGEFN